MKKIYLVLLLVLTVFVAAPKARAVTIDELSNEVASLRQQLSDYRAQALIPKAGEVKGTFTADVTSAGITALSGDLSVGLMDNGDVKKLQAYLKQKGFFPETVTPNGWFGPVTLAAVRAFQKANNISENGIVGAKTRAIINGGGTTQATIPSCTVGAAPSITVLYPNGGETFANQQQVSVKWKTCNYSLSTVNIILAYYQNGGSTVTQAATLLANAATANDGNELVTIDYGLLGLQGTAGNGTFYKIFVTDGGGPTTAVIQDSSNSLFTINNNSGSGCIITSFVASPTFVLSGGSSTLNWTTTGCSGSGGMTHTGGTGTGAVVPLNGSLSAGPLYTTTTYTLSVAASGGNPVTSSVTIIVGGTTSGPLSVVPYFGGCLPTGAFPREAICNILFTIQNNGTADVWIGNTLAWDPNTTIKMENVNAATFQYGGSGWFIGTDGGCGYPGNCSTNNETYLAPGEKRFFSITNQFTPGLNEPAPESIRLKLMGIPYKAGSWTTTTINIQPLATAWLTTPISI